MILSILFSEFLFTVPKRKNIMEEEKKNKETLKNEEKDNKKTSKNKKSDKKSKNKNKRKKRLKSLILKIIFAAIFLIFSHRFIGTIRVTHNNDMFPSISDGQFVVIYRLGDYGINSVVFYEQNGKEYFGRVVAMGGDHVSITENGLKINDSIMYNKLPFQTLPPEGKTIDEVVPEGSYYILNDYRERMTDSRTFGCISEIKGVVVFTMKYRDF